MRQAILLEPQSDIDYSGNVVLVPSFVESGPIKALRQRLSQSAAVAFKGGLFGSLEFRHSP
jgi:hypothetical protein